ncbi:MAG: DNA polymerase III subunit delta' [Gammaproteobacteria bacterium]
MQPWQQSLWQQVMKQLQADRFPHALLLSGIKSIGKQQFAETLAARLLCQSAQHADLACGACASCQLLQTNNHPDYLKIFPESEGKMIKVEQIRELVQNVNQTAQCGKYQVVIIAPAEAMNAAASNALLKILEEPTGSVIFLLVSHQTHVVPATVRSRCQIVSFPLPPDQTTSSTWFQQHENYVTRLIQVAQKTLSPVEAAVAYSPEEFEAFYGVLWRMCSDLLQYRLGHAALSLHYSLIAQNFSSEGLLKLLDSGMVLRRHLLEKINLNMQLVYEKLFIAWQGCFVSAQPLR